MSKNYTGTIKEMQIPTIKAFDYEEWLNAPPSLTGSQRLDFGLRLGERIEVKDVLLRNALEMIDWYISTKARFEVYTLIATNEGGTEHWGGYLIFTDTYYRACIVYGKTILRTDAQNAEDAMYRYSNDMMTD